MTINHRSDETYDAYYTYETTIDTALDNGVLETSVTGGWNKYIQECPIYEWRSLNYPSCRANAPGFISPGNNDSGIGL
jgi:hypothetical protein